MTEAISHSGLNKEIATLPSVARNDRIIEDCSEPVTCNPQLGTVIISGLMFFY